MDTDSDNSLYDALSEDSEECDPHLMYKAAVKLRDSADVRVREDMEIAESSIGQVRADKANSHRKEKL